MLGAKIPLKKAEAVKKYIMKNDLIVRELWMVRSKDNIIFPVKKEFKNKDVEFIDYDFKKKEPRKNWKNVLEEKLTKKEFNILKTSHDIVGSIAILEIPEELEKKEKLIAETLLKFNKNVETVLKKAGEHEGVFRTQKMQWLAGKKTKETIHKENNVKIKVDVEKVFFTSRLSTERKRIMQQIKKGEKVLVMFSGCSPYVCVFAKNTEAEKVIGVELNKEGHKYAVENIKINKLNNAEAIQGDVRKVNPKFKEKFDRISMQLPKTADEFLPEAFMVAKKGTIVHFYDFQYESDFENTKKKIKKEADRAKLKIKFLDFVKCGQISPSKYRVCQDFRII
ncbi:class I SAM-dependent methyltransferase family protein [Bacteroidota bacterium]